MIEQTDHRAEEVEDNSTSDMIVSYKTQNEDVSLSRLKVNVRRQDSSLGKEVYLGRANKD